MPEQDVSSERFTRIDLFLLAAAAIMGMIWLWLCWCTMPLRSWNDIRLAPTFGLTLGLPLYPGRDGPAGTWMYGPLPVWLNWPATWAIGPGEAILTAGAINGLVQLMAIAAVAAWWPVRTFADPSPIVRASTACLSVALWPWASWQFIQADNYAIAFGLIANLLLVRCRSSAGAWVAAAFATAAVFCKQTSLAVPASQIVWLWATMGASPAARQAGRLAMTGLLWLLPVALLIPPSSTWFSAVVVPGSLPWTDDPLDRFIEMAPHIAVHALVPTLTWLYLARNGRCSDLFLPMTAWLLAWPLGAASVFKIGGTNNCLQGLPLWLPAAAVVTGASAAATFGCRRTARVAAVAAIMVLGMRIGIHPVRVWRPTTDNYAEAMVLSSQLPQRLWFPWNPLVTVFTERRLYQAEDGLYIRSVVGLPVPHNASLRHLPPRMEGMAIGSRGSEWGLASAFFPGDVERVRLANWTLTRHGGDESRPSER